MPIVSAMAFPSNGISVRRCVRTLPMASSRSISLIVAADAAIAAGGRSTIGAFSGLFLQLRGPALRPEVNAAPSSIVADRAANEVVLLPMSAHLPLVPPTAPVPVKAVTAPGAVAAVEPLAAPVPVAAGDDNRAPPRTRAPRLPTAARILASAVLSSSSPPSSSSAMPASTMAAAAAAALASGSSSLLSSILFASSFSPADGAEPTSGTRGRPLARARDWPASSAPLKEQAPARPDPMLARRVAREEGTRVAAPADMAPAASTYR